MKFIHAADIHLDSPMRGLARYDGAPVEHLRLATRVALGNLVDLALAEEVDALVIAGDLFDGDWLNHGTGAHFAREMSRLAEADIPVVIVAGNHDAASRMSKSLRMPDNVRTLSAKRPETILFDGLALAIHGQSFPEPAVTEDLSASYPGPIAGAVNVGLLHTSADGRPGHDPYAPCDPRRLAEHGYDYWALGHVHQREMLLPDPPIVFSGCLQGRHVRETGPKGATLVHVGPDGDIELEEHVLDHVRWAVCDIDVSGAKDETDVYERASHSLRQTASGCGERLLAVRLCLVGATPVHASLTGEPEKLQCELAAIATEITAGNAWLERTVVRTSTPRAISADGDDAYAELLRTIRAAGNTETAMSRLADELHPLRRKLPGALLADFDPSDPELLWELLEDVERTLPTRLLEDAT